MAILSEAPEGAQAHNQVDGRKRGVPEIPRLH